MGRTRSLRSASRAEARSMLVSLPDRVELHPVGCDPVLERNCPIRRSKPNPSRHVQAPLAISRDLRFQIADCLLKSSEIVRPTIRVNFRNAFGQAAMA